MHLQAETATGTQHLRGLWERESLCSSLNTFSFTAPKHNGYFSVNLYTNSIIRVVNTGSYCMFWFCNRRSPPPNKHARSSQFIMTESTSMEFLNATREHVSLFIFSISPELLKSTTPGRKNAADGWNLKTIQICGSLFIADMSHRRRSYISALSCPYSAPSSLSLSPLYSNISFVHHACLLRRSLVSERSLWPSKPSAHFLQGN